MVSKVLSAFKILYFSRSVIFPTCSSRKPLKVQAWRPACVHPLAVCGSAWLTEGFSSFEREIDCSQG